LVDLSSEGRVFSAEKYAVYFLYLHFSAEKTRLPPFVVYVNDFLMFFCIFYCFLCQRNKSGAKAETPNSSH